MHQWDVSPAQLLEGPLIVMMSTHHFDRNDVSAKKIFLKEYALRIYTFLAKFYTYEENFVP